MPVRPLSDALRKKAEEEINEDPNEVSTALAVLRNWIEQQPDLRQLKISDQWLIGFLRGSKFNIQKAQHKLETYYTLKNVAPEIAANRDPFDPTIQEILKTGFMLPLRKCSKEDSPRTCLVIGNGINGTKHSLTDLIKEVIVDAKNLPFGILTQWTPTLAKKIIACAEKSLSVRFKSLHLLNSARGLKVALQIFKLFLAVKMKTRIHVYKKDHEKLYRKVDKSILPVEYGGSDGNVQDLIDYWKKKVESYRDWFLQYDAIKTEESIRADSESIANMLGVVKSFKNLDID